MIRGNFDEEGYPYIHCRINLPRLGISDTIHFLLDTGAARTAIHPWDGERLGLPYRRLSGNINMRGIGGISRYFLEPAILTFPDESLTLEYEYRVDIGIMPYGSAPHIRLLPSILGRDVLNNWRILYDPPANRLECAVTAA